MTTATKIFESQNQDHLAARRTADYIVNLLDDFIPRGSRNDAWELLMKASIESGMELTTSTMRKEYEAWKSLYLEGLNLMPQTGLSEKLRED